MTLVFGSISVCLRHIHIHPHDHPHTYLKQDRPTFSDGSLVFDWVQEAQRLRLVPFLERAEHLKALSFDDLNLFRARQVCVWW